MSFFKQLRDADPWIFPNVIKKRVCEFLLRRYVGNWLKEDSLGLDQLAIDMSNGRMSVKEIELDVANINEKLDDFGVPLEVADFYIGNINVSVPWEKPLTENSHVEVQKLQMTVRHKARNAITTSLFDSMLFNNMTTSVKLAEECLKVENNCEQIGNVQEPYASYHDFLQFFEAIYNTVLVRVTGTMLDTTIHFEHFHDDMLVILEVKIDKVEFYDDEAMSKTEPEGNTTPPPPEETEKQPTDKRKVCDVASVRCKNLILYGVKIYMIVEKENPQPAKKQNDSVMIANFTGKQLLKVNFSKDKESSSFKMIIEPHIEGLNLVLSPEILSWMNKVASDITSSSVSDRKEKLMTSEDFEKIKKGLEGANSQTIEGFNRQTFGEEDLFQSIIPSMYGNYSSNSGFQSLESSASSNTSGSTVGGGGARGRCRVYPEKKVKQGNQDGISSTEISARISFLSVVLLHANTPHSDITWKDNLLSFKEKYFDVVESTSLMGVVSASQLVSTRKEFSKLVGQNHFSLMMKQVEIDVALNNELIFPMQKFDVGVGLADFAEAIFDDGSSSVVDFCGWLTFEEGYLIKKDADITSIGLPSFKINVEVLPKEGKPYLRFLPSMPKFGITLTTSKCSSEVDVTVLDRIRQIQAALAPVDKPSPAQNGQSYFGLKEPSQSFLVNLANDVEDYNLQKLCLSLNSSCWTFKIRIPKVDMTESSRSSTRSGRSLHDDLLSFEVQKLNMKTQLIVGHQSLQDLEIYFMCARGVFQTRRERHCFIHIAGDSQTDGHDDGFDWPGIKMKFAGETSALYEVNSGFNGMGLESMLTSYCPVLDSESNSPFSSKRIMYKDREFIEPGDRTEMSTFLDKESNNSVAYVDINFKQVFIYIPNKDMLELLYNRLLGDMILWSPQQMEPEKKELTSSCFHPYLYAGAFKSDYSVPGEELNGNQDRDEESDASTFSIKQNKICISVAIHEGQIVAKLPHKNSKKHGKFLLRVNDLALVFVGSYHGDPMVQYLCLQVLDIDLRHNGSAEDKRGMRPEDPLGRISDRNLNRILRSTGREGYGLALPEQNSKDALSLTLMVKEASDQLVHYKMSAAIRGCTLYHLDDINNENMWILQLTELASLVDYDIPGYQLPQSISELHFSLNNCSVDYRPSNLPYHAVLFSQCVHLTSNAIAGAVGYTLKSKNDNDDAAVENSGNEVDAPSEDGEYFYCDNNNKSRRDVFGQSYDDDRDGGDDNDDDCPKCIFSILLEDTGLFLAGKKITKGIDLKEDFVCVAEVNTFEMSMKSMNEFNKKRPQMDLKASVNMLNVRTCADSFVALSETIIHLANIGEAAVQSSSDHQLIAKSPIPPVSMSPIPPTTSKEENQLPDSQDVDEIKRLIEDAMNDVAGGDDDDNDSSPGHPGCSKREGGNLSSVSWNQLKFDEKPVANVYYNPLMSSQESTSSSFASGGSDGGGGGGGGSPFVNHQNFSDFKTSQKSSANSSVSSNTELNFIDNYFAKPVKPVNAFGSEKYPMAVERYVVTDTSVTWFMYGGLDFSKAPISSYSRQKRKSDEKPTKPSWQNFCGKYRDHSVLMELQLSKMQILHEVYPNTTPESSRNMLLIRDVEVRDRLEISDINKFLYLYSSEEMPRQTNTNMVVVSALHVRPENVQDRTECLLRISLQPIKLNIDQDSLSFLSVFFTEISSMASTKNEVPAKSSVSLSSTPTHKSHQLNENQEKFVPALDSSLEVSTSSSSSSYSPVFIRSVKFSPEVLIKIDYKGKRVEQGTLVGLLVGLTQLNRSQITLKRIHYRRGFLGVDRMAEYMFNEWVTDIKTNQLSGLLRGVGPMHSFFQFAQGVRDLFWMPVEQYRKDGRIMWGIQRGTYSFASCTALSALELTNKLFNAILLVAEAAHDVVSPAPANRSRGHGPRKGQRSLTQPEDLREGVTRACEVVKEGLTHRASELIDTVSKEHEQKGVAGAIGGVLRQIPPTVIEPIIVASKATSNVLGGVRNQLLPDMKQEDIDKWKSHRN